jgi:hypothetical protein
MMASNLQQICCNLSAKTRCKFSRNYGRVTDRYIVLVSMIAKLRVGEFLCSIIVQSLMAEGSARVISQGPLVSQSVQCRVS